MKIKVANKPVKLKINGVLAKLNIKAGATPIGPPDDSENYTVGKAKIGTAKVV